MYRGVDRDPRQVAGPQRAAGMGHPQALGQQQFQLVAEALPPVAQVRALMQEAVLEELLAGEVLEVRIIDPALATVSIVTGSGRLCCWCTIRSSNVHQHCLARNLNPTAPFAPKK